MTSLFISRVARAWSTGFQKVFSCIYLLAFLIASPGAFAFVVSGTVSGPDGPVADVPVFANDVQFATTDANGFFSGEAGSGYIIFYAEPGSGLLPKRVGTDIGGDREIRLVVNQQVTISGTFELPAGVGDDLDILLTRPGSFDREWAQINGNSFTADMPAGIYAVSVSPSGFWQDNRYYEPTAEYYAVKMVDASAGSVSNVFIPAAEPFAKHHRNDPPRSALISIEAIDEGGIATVRGATGAADGVALISVVNLQTGQVAEGFSAADGSFAIRMFAPPGTSLAVHQDLTSHGIRTLAPATVVRAPIAGEDQGVFAASGVVGGDSPWGTDPATVSSVGFVDTQKLWLTGTLDSTNWAAGQSGTLEGRAVLYSMNVPDINLATMELDGYVALERIFDAQGNQEHAFPEAMSHVLTPTGFPVERRLSIDSLIIGRINYWTFSQTSDRSAESTWSADYSLPADLPDGVYQLTIIPSQWQGPSEIDTVHLDNVFATNFIGDRYHNAGAATEITVGAIGQRKLTSVLLLNELSEGSRGLVAIEDRDRFQIAGHVSTQAKDFILPMTNPRSGQPHVYNLEPFAPQISASNKGTPNPPTVNLDLPSGVLHVRITRPDGSLRDLGTASYSDAYLQGLSQHNGKALAGNEPTHYFGLTTGDPKYEVSFDQYGLHTISVDGYVDDIFGTRYVVAGTYELFIAKTLDFETGVMGSTPFEVGNSFAPAVIVQPGVPADIEVQVQHYPNSDPGLMQQATFTGTANRYGYYFPGNETPFQFTEAGEYRVDYTASYVDENGALWMGSRSWGSVVETPGTPIITHGRRGFDDDFREGSPWEVLSDDANVGVHLNVPYHNGDVMWMEEAELEPRNIANILAATVQDTEGTLTQIMTPRAQLSDAFRYSFDERVRAGEIPLFSSTSTELSPALKPDSLDTHWSYSYAASVRPGLQVREMVTEFSTDNSYWRFDNAYNYQRGVGPNGDLTNDFKFQFNGAVYRAPDQNFNFYGAYGSLFVLLPPDEPVGGRVTPPFQGASGGPNGGPLFTLKGKDIDMFFHPTGIRPGSILEVGNTVSLAGQIAPTLNSKVNFVITTPSGSVRHIGGQANKVGYYYDPATDFVVSEPGVYTVDLSIQHDGMTSTGPVQPPYPIGDVLGSNAGRYSFYVVDKEAEMIETDVDAESLVKPGLGPLELELSSADELSNTQLHYTATMPGFILEQGFSTSLAYSYDAPSLSLDFPNLDTFDYDVRTGVDTVTLNFLISGVDGNGVTRYRARQLLLQGEELIALSPAATPASASLAMNLNEQNFTVGDTITLDMTSTALGEDVDLYIALLLPGGAFFTLSNSLEVSAPNSIIPYQLGQNLNSSQDVTVLSVPLPAGLDAGSYAFYGIAVQAGSSVLEQANWITVDDVSFTID